MADKPAYELRISRKTVDKLGVKLYDKVSAVVAELVANSYDADAEKVTVRLPLATELARKVDGEIKDKGFVVEVIDDGRADDEQQRGAWVLSHRGRFVSAHDAMDRVTPLKGVRLRIGRINIVRDVGFPSRSSLGSSPAARGGAMCCRGRSPLGRPSPGPPLH